MLHILCNYFGCACLQNQQISSRKTDRVYFPPKCQQLVLSCLIWMNFLPVCTSSPTCALSALHGHQNTSQTGKVNFKVRKIHSWSVACVCCCAAMKISPRVHWCDCSCCSRLLHRHAAERSHVTAWFTGSLWTSGCAWWRRVCVFLWWTDMQTFLHQLRLQLVIVGTVEWQRQFWWVSLEWVWMFYAELICPLSSS